MFSIEGTGSVTISQNNISRSKAEYLKSSITGGSISDSDNGFGVTDCQIQSGPVNDCPAGDKQLVITANVQLRGCSFAGIGIGAVNVAASGITIFVDSTNFTECGLASDSSNSGGAIFTGSNPVDLRVTGCNFIRCNGRYGGAIDMMDSTFVSITGSRFSECKSYLSGSAISVKIASTSVVQRTGVILLNTVFEKCSSDATSMPQAVQLTLDSSMMSLALIQACLFDSCNGGGLVSRVAYLNLFSCVFKDCKQNLTVVNGGGGGLQTYIDKGSTTVGRYHAFNCTFNGCYGRPTGGAMELGCNPPMVIEQCEFVSCKGDDVDSSDPDDEGCGGAVYITDMSSQSVSFIKCSFKNNYASVSGGAIYINEPKIDIGRNAIYDITGCSFEGNNAGGGTSASVLDVESCKGAKIYLRGNSVAFHATSGLAGIRVALLTVSEQLEIVDNCMMGGSANLKYLMATGNAPGSIKLQKNRIGKSWNEFSQVTGDILLSSQDNTYSVSDCDSFEPVPNPEAAGFGTTDCPANSAQQLVVRRDLYLRDCKFYGLSVGAVKITDMRILVVFEHSTFENCGAIVKNLDGGAIFAENGVYISLRSCSFTGCLGENGAGVYFNNSALVRIESCVFSNCTSRLSGNAVYIKLGQSRLGVTNAVITSCKFDACNTTEATERGALCILKETGTANSNSKATVDQCMFGNCLGSGIFTKAAFLTVTSCSFTDCHNNKTTANGGGGGIQSNSSAGATYDGELLIQKCNFTNCIAMPTGGAIELGITPSCTISQCRFKSCKAIDCNGTDPEDEGCGGVLYITEKCYMSVTLVGCDISDCSATVSSGAIHINQPGDTASRTGSYSITKCVFNGCSCGSSAGKSCILAEQLVTLSLTDCKFVVSSTTTDGHISLVLSPETKSVSITGNCFSVPSTGAATIVLVGTGTVAISGNTFTQSESAAISKGSASFTGTNTWTAANCDGVNPSVVAPTALPPEPTPRPTGSPIPAPTEVPTASTPPVASCPVEDKQFEAKSSIQLDKCVFSGISNSAIFTSVQGVSLVLNSVKISNCGTTSVKGGGLQTSGSSTTLRATDCEFTNCIGSEGGGVYIYNIFNLYVKSCKFVGCSSNKYGSALSSFIADPIKANTTVIQFLGCSFEDCSSSGTSVPQAININSATATNGFAGVVVDSCNFKKCNGGGLTVRVGYLQLTSCTFNECRQNLTSRNGGGGGLQTYASGVYSGDFRIADCKFESCFGRPTGGALELGVNPPMKIERCSFIGCRAEDVTTSDPDDEGCGGAIYFTDLSLESTSIIGCSFKDNTATCSGGAIYVNYPETGLRRSGVYDVRGCQFEGNYVNNGTGFSTIETEYIVGLTIDDCKFLFSSKGSCLRHIQLNGIQAAKSSLLAAVVTITNSEMFVDGDKKDVTFLGASGSGTLDISSCKIEQSKDKYLVKDGSITVTESNVQFNAQRNPAGKSGSLSGGAIAGIVIAVVVVVAAVVVVVVIIIKKRGSSRSSTGKSEHDDMETMEAFTTTSKQHSQENIWAGDSAAQDDTVFLGDAAPADPFRKGKDSSDE